MTEDELRRAIAEAMSEAFKNQAKNAPSGGGTGMLSKSAESLGGAFKEFGKQVNSGGGRLSEVSNTFAKKTKSVFGPLSTAFGGITTGIQYLEETTDQFRRLSKVGGGAAGSLGALRAQAGRANLSLDAFAGIVERNAQNLVGFGGGLESGQRKVAELGSAMFDTGIIDRFMALGYSIEEANEFVVKNTALQNRQAMLEGMSTAQQVSSAAALAKNMQIMAKLTGKDVQQMQDELMERQRSGSTQAALRLMEMDGVTNAGAAYQGVQSTLQAGSSTLRNLFDDLTQAQAPLTASTQQYAAVNQEAYQLAMQARNAMARGDEVKAKELAAQAVAAEQQMATSRQGLTIATYGQISDIAKGQADVLQETGDIITGVQAAAKKMGIATNTAAGHMEAFSKALETITTQVSTQQMGRAPGQDALKLINESEQALAETAGDINEQIGLQIESNTHMVTAFQKATGTLGTITSELEVIADTISGVPGSSTNQVGDLQSRVGDTTDTGNTITQDHVKLLQTALDPMKPMSERIQASEILNATGIMDNGMLKTTLQGINSTLLSESKSSSTAEKTEQDTGVGKSMWDKIKDAVPGLAEGGTLGAGMLGVVGEGGGMQNAELLTGPATVTPMTTMANALQTQFSSMTNQMQNAMKQDATGVPQALQDVMADLKAVAPKTDDIDPAQMKTQMSAMKKQMQEIQNSPDLIQMMQQLIEINRKTMENTNKQFKLSTDNMRGI